MAGIIGVHEPVEIRRDGVTGWYSNGAIEVDRIVWLEVGDFNISRGKTDWDRRYCVRRNRENIIIIIIILNSTCVMYM